jgi:DNA primase
VVNFDPDAAGDRAAEKKLPLLLEQGFQVRIMELDGGLDPDEYCKVRGASAYGERLASAKGYFHWIADRARAQHDLHTSEGQVAVLKQLVSAVKLIPDLLERMQIANEVASYVGVNQGMVLDAFKKSVADRNQRSMQPPTETVRADEKGLLNVLLSDAEGREELVAHVGTLEVLQRVATRRIFQAVLAIHAGREPITFDSLNSRLEPADQSMLAVAVLSADGEGNEFTVEYGMQCLESLRRTDDGYQRKELKNRVKEAERTGNLKEALRLAQELQDLERKKVRAS